MNSPLLKSTSQTRHLKSYVSGLKVFRLRNSPSAFFTLLALFVLTSVCFLLLSDLHTRYAIANNGDEETPISHVSDPFSPTQATSLREQLSSLAQQMQQHSSVSCVNCSSKYKRQMADKLWSLIDEYPWFVKSNGLRPSASLSSLYSNLPLFPDEDSTSDRIVNQLMYLPPNHQPHSKEKIIYIHNALFTWNRDEINMKQNIFTKNQCPVDTCSISIDPSQAEHAHAVIFKVIFTLLLFAHNLSPHLPQPLFPSNCLFTVFSLRVPCSSPCSAPRVSSLLSPLSTSCILCIHPRKCITTLSLPPPQISPSIHQLNCLALLVLTVRLAESIFFTIYLSPFTLYSSSFIQLVHSSDSLA